MKKSDFLIIISLLISLFIYLFYRTEKTVINELVIRVISIENYVNLRQAVNKLLPLNGAVIYSLPEGLWVFCITITSKLFYIQFYNRKIDGALIPLIFFVGLEILQLLNFTNGRFDFMDILVSFLFWFLALYLFRKNTERQHILKPINRQSLICLASYGIIYFSHVIE